MGRARHTAGSARRHSDREAALFRRFGVALPDATAAVELPLEPAPGGRG